MKNALLMALLVPALALAVSNLNPVTTVVREDGSAGGGPVVRVDGGGRPGQPRALVGVVDTVGGTTYDWQVNGPVRRTIVTSTDYGVHVLWMYSSSSETTFPDRNMRYNFFDFTTGQWNWIDPDFMQSGVNVYTERSGYGNLDADPTTGVAITSAHNGSPIHAEVARDMAPGAGLFEYCSSSPSGDAYQWPYIAVGQNSAIECVEIDEASTAQIFFAEVDPWCTWSSPVGLAAPQPDPGFPNQNIAASKVSEKICAVWELSTGSPDPGFYRISTDGGTSWESAEELPWPPAFGGDTATSYHISSMFAYYDLSDGLHIVANVMPFVDGSGYIIPAQLWHWSPDNTPNWSHITTATCDPANLGAAVGYNTMYAARPSIGEDPQGNLYVSWEQFDSSNVEPGPPEFLRADIFVAGSGDNGQTWTEPLKITDPGSGSHRFPSIVDLTSNQCGFDDFVAIRYMIDEQAGFFVQGEGPATNNPVCVHWVPTTTIGIAEPGTNRIPVRAEMEASPNPFGGRTRISYALPRTTNVSLVVHDAAGRPVRTLEDGRREAGRYTASWNARTDDGRSVAAGIYFYTLTTDDTSLTEKLTVVR